MDELSSILNSRTFYIQIGFEFRKYLRTHGEILRKFDDIKSWHNKDNQQTIVYIKKVKIIA